MLALIALPLGFAGFVATMLLCLRLFERRPADPAVRPRIASEPRKLGDVGWAKPCWTEEIGRDSRYSYWRSHCLNDELIEMDSRARRGDFPLPPSD